MGYSNRFMQDFALTVPILQAPVGPVTCLALAEAVGRAGGMGSLAFSNLPLGAALDLLVRLNGLGLPYFVNYLACFRDTTVLAVAEAGARAITFSWGFEPALIARVRATGTRVGVQVGSAAGAKAARAAGADFLIAQGIEAGGHVQSTQTLARLLPQVLAEAGRVPVIAAGGIGGAAAIASALAGGAQGVMLGSRYVATEESAAHADYKAALVAARATDTSFTNCFDGGWPNALHRVLRNATVEMWEAAGCPPAPDRPGEGDLLAEGGGQALRRYDCDPPLAGMQGDVPATCLYAGESVDAIDAVEPAGALTLRLWQEALALMEHGR